MMVEKPLIGVVNHTDIRDYDTGFRTSLGKVGLVVALDLTFGIHQSAQCDTDDVVEMELSGMDDDLFNVLVSFHFKFLLKFRYQFYIHQ